ncbi:EamA family transporter [Cellulosimicrobium protaetiae]|uniref:EamA family transporter n=1 Tax=Cellulosimicrobium protaetiae TaxID=2587808 RepID=A0A6M5UME6_9MICO|nr:EamA family transporter [Cellulosimicrobium protaetiae]QJW38019.1 EamA family transporter [Cellulosimicrobium protaetiae]
MPTRSAALDRVPVPALFVVSGLTQYLGAAIAVGLFAVAGAVEIGWLRVAASALLLLAWRRPWRRRWTRHDLAWVCVFGVALAAMNLAFYVAIDHLPLGTAVAIEFLGPVAVAAVTGSGWRERGAIAVAAVGVVLLAGVTIESGLPREDAVLGLAAIGVAAACWAAYILLGRRVAVAGSGVTSLAVAMTVGALVFAPFLAPAAVPVLGDWRYVVAVAGIALFSSVVPYALEQVILRRVSAATFSVLLALLPATAAAVGAVVLRQVPTVPELVGLALVSGAIAMTASRRGGRDGGSADDGEVPLDPPPA